jgi:hypothetical protein
MNTTSKHLLAIGRVLLVSSPRGVPTKFVVTGYNDKDYMQMSNVRNSFEGMTLHPEHVARIVANTEGDSGIKVLDCESLLNVEVLATEETLPVEAMTRVQSNPTVVKTASTTGPTKKERAALLKAANPTLSRKEMIQLFMKELDMTVAGASTYYSYR